MPHSEYERVFWCEMEESQYQVTTSSIDIKLESKMH